MIHDAPAFYDGLIAGAWTFGLDFDATVLRAERAGCEEAPFFFGGVVGAEFDAKGRLQGAQLF
ncbi:MAG: hypothetical protein WB679_05130 [Terracidiphilus sp.]